MAVAMDDLVRRLEVYSDQLPKQARWEAELFLLDAEKIPAIARILSLSESAVKSTDRAVEAANRMVQVAERLAPAVERAVAVAESVPKSVAAERETVLTQVRADVAQERKEMTQDMERISLLVVDHAFWRAAQLTAAVLTLALIAGLVFFFRHGGGRQA